MKKRLLSTVIMLALILSFTPLVSLNAEAAASYSVSKALEYAKAHWNDGVGACATFVSRCVIAGGINIKSQSTTRDCYEAVCKATGLPQKQLKLNSSGQATKALNKDILAAGDIVFQYCNTHKKSPHILLCSGFDKNGAALYYAHNNALNNKTYQLNKNTGSGHDTSCDIVGKVVHISSLDKQDYTVELFNNYSGRNYMPAVSASNFNSGDFFSRDSSVATVTGDASVKRIDSCDSLKIVNSSAGSSGKDLVFATYTSGRTVDGAYAENQTLTLGFWAKASSPGAKMFFRWGYESSYRSVTLTGGWAYYTVKMDKTTANNSHMHPYVDRAGTVWLSEIQLEEGNTATAYSAETGGKLGNLTVTSGEKYTGLPTPERSGYTFNGWYTKPAGGTLITTSSNVLPGHIRLFAHWTAHVGAPVTAELFNNYSGRNYMPAVSASNFNSGSFFPRDTSVATVTGDSSVKRIDSCDSLKIVNSSAGSSGKDLAFITYTSERTFDGAYAENQTLTLSFWAKASSPGTKMFFRWGYESSYRSVTLTGDWAYYTVKMDKTTANNSYMHPYVDRAGTVWLSEIQLEEGNTATAFSAETGGKMGELTLISGEKYTGLPTPERSGYTFDGWYTKPAGGMLITDSSNVLPGHIRLFAHWTAYSGASAVDDLILAIGSVSWSSGEAIAAARSAYDALPETQKALVKNLDLLTAAEARYGLWKRGDINCDGRIDMQDLSILLSVYGSQSAQSDIVPDSFINANDLSVLLINYGAKL